MKSLTEYDSDKILRKYVPIAKNQLVKSSKEIKIKKFPLALKIMSQDALHKSEINGVRKVNNQQELEKNFKDLLSIARKRKLKLQGILVQEYFDGQNFIIGIKKDETFGHVILFGLGGIFTEIVKDFSIRKCPIEFNEAESMLEDLRAKKIFHGFRNIKLNVKLLKKILVRISNLPKKHKNIIELDINPFILNEKTGKAVDSRIVLS
ncbi:acetate--CoA ligase family protein [Candidatus Woesearchaeota archaeon]|nr:acetate--CoA ligase family protein [Candidatus Woesearchaeota archaeon]